MAIIGLQLQAAPLLLKDAQNSYSNYKKMNIWWSWGVNKKTLHFKNCFALKFFTFYKIAILRKIIK